MIRCHRWRHNDARQEAATQLTGGDVPSVADAAVSMEGHLISCRIARPKASTRPARWYAQHATGDNHQCVVPLSGPKQSLDHYARSVSSVGSDSSITGSDE
jgi:hypothetical protein